MAASSVRRRSEAAGVWRRLRQSGRRVRTKDAQVQFAVEEGDATTVRRDEVRGAYATGARSAPEAGADEGRTSSERRNTVDRAARRRVVGGRDAGSPREMREAAEGLKDREDARIAEAERGDPLSANPEGLLQAIERVGVNVQ